jgi:hypothetical protein
VSAEEPVLKEFANKQGGKIVLKVLTGFGGRGTHLAETDSPFWPQTITTLTKDGREPLMAQAFLPEIARGDKRIFLFDGKPLGALLRIPADDGFLANPDLGASVRPSPLSAKEKRLCADLAPFLRKNGIFFAGIDVIGEKLTEINITSPGMLWEWNEADGASHERAHRRSVRTEIEASVKKTLTAFLLLVSLTVPAYGWNLSDHREIARRSLEDVAKGWSLDVPCEVHLLASFLDKLKPLREPLGDPWQFSASLKINPKIDIGAEESLRFPEGDAKGKKFLTPIRILELYSTDPDDGRDQDLFVRDASGQPHAAFEDEKWFGAVQGPNSQAFRHIEKPPFSLAHPLRTLGIPFRSVGEASQRAEIYFQLSRLAFALEEDYWGWRFLAGGLHYLEDLHQPYHAGQITPLLFRKGLGILLSWGGRKKASWEVSPTWFRTRTVFSKPTSTGPKDATERLRTKR